MPEGLLESELFGFEKGSFTGALNTKPGKFQLPAGMFIDSEDRIYVVDQLNRRVQVFQYLGERWKKSGGSPQSEAAKE